MEGTYDIIVAEGGEDQGAIYIIRQKKQAPKAEDKAKEISQIFFD